MFLKEDKLLKLSYFNGKKDHDAILTWLKNVETYSMVSLSWIPIKFASLYSTSQVKQTYGGRPKRSNTSFDAEHPSMRWADRVYAAKRKIVRPKISLGTLASLTLTHKMRSVLPYPRVLLFIVSPLSSSVGMNLRRIGDFLPKWYRMGVYPGRSWCLLIRYRMLRYAQRSFLFATIILCLHRSEIKSYNKIPTHRIWKNENLQISQFLKFQLRNSDSNPFWKHDRNISETSTRKPFRRHGRNL